MRRTNKSKWLRHTVALDTVERDERGYASINISQRIMSDPNGQPEWMYEGSHAADFVAHWEEDNEGRFWTLWFRTLAGREWEHAERLHIRVRTPVLE